MQCKKKSMQPHYLVQFFSTNMILEETFFVNEVKATGVEHLCHSTNSSAAQRPPDTVASQLVQSGAGVGGTVCGSLS